jgi:hypothetical protein
MIYLTKNFWGYEKLLPPPQKISDKLKTVYLTDDENNRQILLDLGWDMVKVVEDYKEITDKLKRRLIISEINCFPIKFVPELADEEFIFLCDSNIETIWPNYFDFVDNCTSDKCLFLTTKWYKGNRDNIISECESSNSPRWGDYFNDIVKSKDEYVKIITEMGIDVNTISVASAKYFGWNIKHEKYNEISNTFFNEYKKHIQGNIILSYLSVIFNNFTYIYDGDNIGGSVARHNFEG